MSNKLPAETPELEVVSKASILGAMISRTLPSYHGPLPVGVCDLELPVPHETFGTFTHTTLPKDSPAGLSLDTILYSIFYPTTDEPTSKKVIWFPNPWQTIDGFIRMARRTPNFIYRAIAYPLAAAAIYGTTFPAKPNMPLRMPPSPDKKWPLVIFSHGVGCSRLMYSSYCGELASNGYVVLAIEHRDGTSPSSTIVSDDGRAKTLNWLQWTDLYWPDLPADQQPRTDTILRHFQLKLRVKEIYYAIDSMTRIANGQDVTVASVRRPDFDWSRWNGAIETTKPIMTGHSLGGSAAILAGADSTFNFGGIIAFDPAIERLEPWSSPIPAPILILNSEEFTKSPDFVLLQKLLTHAKQVAGIFSIAGSTHPALSDVFLIIPGFIGRMTGLSCEATRVLSLSVRASLRFLGFGGRTGLMGQDSITAFLKGAGAGATVEGRGDYKVLAPGTFVRHDLSEVVQTRNTTGTLAD